MAAVVQRDIHFLCLHFHDHICTDFVGSACDLQQRKFELISGALPRGLARWFNFARMFSRVVDWHILNTWPSHLVFETSVQKLGIVVLSLWPVAEW